MGFGCSAHLDEDNVRTRLGEANGDGLADAPRPSGDERRVAFEGEEGGHCERAATCGQIIMCAVKNFWSKVEEEELQALKGLGRKPGRVTGAQPKPCVSASGCSCPPCPPCPPCLPCLPRDDVDWRGHLHCKSVPKEQSSANIVASNGALCAFLPLGRVRNFGFTGEMEMAGFAPYLPFLCTLHLSGKKLETPKDDV